MRNTQKFGLGAILVPMAMFASSAFAAETYYTDQGHTEVKFGWSHAGVSVQTGEFTKAEGKLVLDPDNIGNASLEVTLDPSSVSTGFVPLDDHLKSADFFEVEKYPEIKFVSTSVVKTGEKTADVIGDMTIHGVTQPVTFATELTHIGEHPLGAAFEYYHGKWTAFKATATIDHQSFDVGGFSTGPITIDIVTELKAR